MRAAQMVREAAGNTQTQEEKITHTAQRTACVIYTMAKLINEGESRAGEFFDNSKTVGYSFESSSPAH